MAWWAHTVLGGDTPLDILDDLLDNVVGIDTATFVPGEGNKATIEAKQKELEEYAKNPPEWLGRDDHTIYLVRQVVGFLILSSGATLPPAVKDLLLRAIRNDVWAAEAKEVKRQKLMQEYEEIVLNYNGEAVDWDGFGKYAPLSKDSVPLHKQVQNPPKLQGDEFQILHEFLRVALMPHIGKTITMELLQQVSEDLKRALCKTGSITL